MTEKTEQPTPKKLRKAREEGQVAHSKDLTQWVLFAALFGYLIVDSSAISRRMSEMMILPGHLLGMDFKPALNILLAQLLRDGLWLVLPFLLIILLLGLFTEMLQTRMLFAPKALKLSGKKLNPIENAKNMFGPKGLFDFAKSVLKILVLSAVVYVTLRDALGGLMTLPQGGVRGLGLALLSMVTTVVLKVIVVYACIAAADWFWQNRRYRKQLMMSIDEVRRDYKEEEGDPHFKHERKSVHQQMLQEQSVNSARHASVLVTNPVHLAIALVYVKGLTPLPVVTAKGEGALAVRMVQAARAAGIPVMENVPLAWSLMRTAPVDQFIPSELVGPVAEIIRLVQLNSSAGGD